MCVAVTNGIEVKVKPTFEPDMSKPMAPAFLFSYDVTIKNNSNESIKLLSRVWNIFDSIGEHLNIEGEGVIGLQPIILPGSSFNYQSNVIIKSGIGFMEGKYTVINHITNEQFKIQIPRFELVAPFTLN